MSELSHGSKSTKHDCIVTIALDLGGDEGYTAVAVASRIGEAAAPVTATRDDENPYEAAWNALAAVLTDLGYDEVE